MKKKNTRIIGCSRAITEYPQTLRSPFDQRLHAGLSWIVIDTSLWSVGN